MLIVLKEIVSICIDIFQAISIIAVWVLIVLNVTSIYPYIIQKYNLVKYTGLTEEILIDNYNRLINYVQNPFVEVLELNRVPVSYFGKIHFYEVKRIFIGLYIISIVFIIFNIFKILKEKRSNFIMKLIKRFNRSSNVIVLIVLFLAAMAKINFSKTFIYFHKIFFKNNYWIFDPSTDPIINALPEEFFMIELIIIMLGLFIFTILVKFIYFRYKSINKQYYDEYINM